MFLESNFDRLTKKHACFSHTMPNMNLSFPMNNTFKSLFNYVKVHLFEIGSFHFDSGVKKNKHIPFAFMQELVL